RLYSTLPRLLISTLFPYTTLFRSLAYFSDDVTAHNVITTGGVEVKLIETTDGGETFPVEGITGVMPGQTVTKVVTVDNIGPADRSEEHTSELQSRFDLVCRLLLEK